VSRFLFWELNLNADVNLGTREKVSMCSTPIIGGRMVEAQPALDLVSSEPLAMTPVKMARVLPLLALGGR
jgi:hypothetical protein